MDQSLVRHSKKNNITVLPILSSNVIEAWTNEAILAPPYMIEEHEIVEEALTKAGLRIIFTSLLLIFP